MNTEQTSARSLIVTGTKDFHQTCLLIGDNKRSSLWAKCNALGKILLQEVDTNPNTDQKQLADLLSRLDKISLKITKALNVDKPRVEKLMNLEFEKQERRDKSDSKGFVGSQYAKQLKHLDLNTENINEVMNEITEKVFERVPQESLSDFTKLTEALDIYEKTLGHIPMAQHTCLDLLGSIHHSKFTLEKADDNKNTCANDDIVNQLISSHDDLILRCETLLQTFEMQTVNDMPLQVLINSADQKNVALMKKLIDGDLGHSDVLLAVAKKHNVGPIVYYIFTELQKIEEAFDTLREEVSRQGMKTEPKNRDAITRALLAPRSRGELSENFSQSKSRKKDKKPPKKIPATLPAKNPADKVTDDAIRKSSTATLQNELIKAADWLRHDINTLKNSTSSGGQHLAEVLSDELDEIYKFINLYDQASNQTKPEEFKKNIEQQLTNLEKLTAEALATENQETIPTRSSTSSPISQNQKAPPELPTLKQKVPPAINKREHSSTTLDSISTVTQASGLESTKFTDALDMQIEIASHHLSSIHAGIFYARTKQENFKQSIVASRQAHEVTWINIQHTDMVLNSLSEAALAVPHSLYIRPYVEYTLPMADMLLAIQAEKSNPHFDQINCQGYLEEATALIGTLRLQLDYVQHLMAFTEAMIYPSYRFA